MEIGKLDHVNIRTTRLDIMIDWYTNVLGMHSGARPDFPFPGAWMYAGGVAAVHLVGINDKSGIGSEVDLKLEHFAFSATGGAKFEAKLQEMSVQYRRADIPEIGLYQINLWDADGNHIHLDFLVDD
jgi:catechol 2,3-dioxygenase-like lactoylglutathione lyase family enzyme